MKEALLLNDSAQIVGCELSQVADLSVHSEDPYEEMAMRLVYHALNGPISRRIEAGIHHAKQAAQMVQSGLITGVANIPLAVQ